jgi:predicted RNA-binding protein YlqC (UPF0109 family)
MPSPDRSCLSYPCPQFDEVPNDDVEPLSTRELYQELLIALAGPETRRYVYVAERTLAKCRSSLEEGHQPACDALVDLTGQHVSQMVQPPRCTTCGGVLGEVLQLTVHCHPADIGKCIGKEGKCLEEMTRVLNRIEGRNRVQVALEVAH